MNSEEIGRSSGPVVTAELLRQLGFDPSRFVGIGEGSASMGNARDAGGVSVVLDANGNPTVVRGQGGYWSTQQGFTRDGDNWVGGAVSDPTKENKTPFAQHLLRGAAVAALPVGLGYMAGAAPAAATGAGGAATTGAVASPVAAGSATFANMPALGAGASSGLGGLLSNAAGSAGNWIKDNPWTAAGLAGLLGAGLSQQMSRPEAPAQYTPQNLGGNFQPRAQAQYQPLPDRSGMTLNTQPGQANSGLWRFMR